MTASRRALVIAAITDHPGLWDGDALTERPATPAGRDLGAEITNALRRRPTPPARAAAAGARVPSFSPASAEVAA
jgi:hypothetical protein